MRLLDDPDGLPLWIVLSCHGAIALGTMFGGWRIVRTMGSKLTRLEPMGGVCAESPRPPRCSSRRTTASR